MKMRESHDDRRAENSDIEHMSIYLEILRDYKHIDNILIFPLNDSQNLPRRFADYNESG